METLSPRRQFFERKREGAKMENDTWSGSKVEARVREMFAMFVEMANRPRRVSSIRVE